MAKCKTPGVWFCFRAGKQTQWASTDNAAEFLMTIPSSVVLTKERAKVLEKALHDAAEKTMAPWFAARKEGT